MHRDGITLAIIPARKGSKRLPGKNMRIFGGKPLIQWTIEAALESRAISDVLVTTDDSLVLELAKSLGVSYLVERPAELASDTAKSFDVVIHALNELRHYDLRPETICLLQATSPLRTAQDIDTAFNLFNEKNRCSIISVCELEHPLAWCNTLGAGSSMISFARTLAQEKRSQDYEKCYRLNGAIYISSSRSFEQSLGFLNEQTCAYVMPRNRSIDIDDIYDFSMAEVLLAHAG